MLQRALSGLQDEKLDRTLLQKLVDEALTGARHSAAEQVHLILRLSKASPMEVRDGMSWERHSRVLFTNKN